MNKPDLNIQEQTACSSGNNELPEGRSGWILRRVVLALASLAIFAGVTRIVSLFLLPAEPTTASPCNTTTQWKIGSLSDVLLAYDLIYLIVTTATLLCLIVLLLFETAWHRFWNHPWQTLRDAAIYLLSQVSGIPMGQAISMLLILSNAIQEVPLLTMFRPNIRAALVRRQRIGQTQGYAQGVAEGRSIGQSEAQDETRSEMIRVLDEMPEISPDQRAAIIARLNRTAGDNKSDT